MKIVRKKEVVESLVKLDATSNRVVRLVVQRGEEEVVVALSPKEARKLAKGLRQNAVIADHLADQHGSFEDF